MGPDGPGDDRVLLALAFCFFLADERGLGRFFLLAFLDLRSGAGDGGDGEVAIGDGRRHPFRQLDVADVDGIADIEAGEVDFDLVGNGLGRAKKLHFVAHHVEGTAALDAGRLIVIDEVNRHLHRDALALAQTQEIHMHQRVAHRIELDIARNGAHLGAVDIEVDEGGQEAPGLHVRPQALVVGGNELRRLLVAVDDAGNAVLATLGPGGPLAGPIARLDRQLDGFGHGQLLDLTDIEKRPGHPPGVNLSRPARRGLYRRRETGAMASPGHRARRQVTPPPGGLRRDKAVPNRPWCGRWAIHPGPSRARCSDACLRTPPR